MVDEGEKNVYLYINMTSALRLFAFEDSPPGKQTNFIDCRLIVIERFLLSFPVFFSIIFYLFRFPFFSLKNFLQQFFSLISHAVKSLAAMKLLIEYLTVMKRGEMKCSKKN